MTVPDLSTPYHDLLFKSAVNMRDAGVGVVL